jgi:hypothetical protein
MRLTAKVLLGVLMSCCSLPTITYAVDLCSPLSGMTAWYPGDGTTDDLVAGNDGSLVGGATFAGGIRGQAFSLDGTNDYVSAPNSTANDPTSKGSISAWVYFEQLPSAAGHIMTVASTGEFEKDFDLVADLDDRLHFYIAAGVHASSTTVVQTGIWYHVTGAWDSTVGLRIYVFGKLEGTNDTLVTRNVSGQPFEIGNSAFFGPRHFNGLIDEVQIFGRALSANEAAAIASCNTCGDANIDQKVTAPDALRILQAAVGQVVECPDNRCDTDANGSIVTSDSLRALQFAVGQAVLLRCPVD